MTAFRPPAYLMNLAIAALAIIFFLLNFNTIPGILYPWQEEIGLILLLAACAAAINGSRLAFASSRWVSMAAILPVLALGIMAVFVYSLGIRVGNYPGGWFEGTALGVSYGLVSILALSFCLLGLLLALHARLNCLGGMGFAFWVLQWSALMLIALPGVVMLLPLSDLTEQWLGFQRLLDPIMWFGYIYEVADWSRAIEPPVGF
jgi:hypothetical protein